MCGSDRIFVAARRRSSSSSYHCGSNLAPARTSSARLLRNSVRASAVLSGNYPRRTVPTPGAFRRKLSSFGIDRRAAFQQQFDRVRVSAVCGPM